ncbi:MAG: ABC transporter permease [Candidatus Melainabacteria bacterium]|nr:ABC transporter permease [Candidatus Melainabacteria bacterium]
MKLNIDNLFSKINPTNIFIATLAKNFIEAAKVISRDLPSGNLYINNLLEYLKRIIWTCLPIATLTVSASSLIYAIHVAPELSLRGLNIYLGGIVALSLIREGVPVLGSLALVTQFCSGMTAQIGSMKITEQLDAMKIVKVQSSEYLLVPMVIAGLVGFPLIMVLCIAMALLINFIFCKFLINITSSLYLTSIFSSVNMKDISLCLVKACIFGFVVTLVSYTCGILTSGGSKEVGNSTKLSVVINFALVVILDYIITALWI